MQMKLFPFTCAGRKNSSASTTRRASGSTRKIMGAGYGFAENSDYWSRGRKPLYNSGMTELFISVIRVVAGNLRLTDSAHIWELLQASISGSGAARIEGTARRRVYR